MPTQPQRSRFSERCEHLQQTTFVVSKAHDRNLLPAMSFRTCCWRRSMSPRISASSRACRGATSSACCERRPSRRFGVAERHVLRSTLNRCMSAANWCQHPECHTAEAVPCSSRRTGTVFLGEWGTRTAAKRKQCLGSRPVRRSTQRTTACMEVQ
jgi:hypothetical protein